MPTDPLAHLVAMLTPSEMVTTGHVFLSYSRRNRDFAKALYGKLTDAGFPLWRDVHDIEAGADDWWQAIQEAIRACDTVVLCMSLPALKSPVVGDEWLYARQIGKRIIPVVADDIWEHPEVKAGTFTLPNWMQRKNWLDFRASVPESEVAWANLLRTLNERYTPKRFISMVEELPPRFVRRSDDMDRAVHGLVDDKYDAVAMTTAFSGAGGYGKTTLAKAVARDVRIQGAFDDAILWVTLGEKLLELSSDALANVLISRVRELIDALTGEKPVIETLEMAQTKLHAAIGELYVLLVIDDVWDAAHLKPFLLDSGKTPHCSYLITTRSLNTVNRDSILKQTIDRMKPIEAAELLSAGFDPDEIKINKVTLRTLAHELREYPLVLALANTQIANYAHDMSLSMADALELGRETLRELGVLGFDDTSAASRDSAVSKTLDVSIRQITPEERQRLYRELAIFPDDALIPLTTLEKYWGLSKVATLQFCQMLYRKTALLHSFEGLSVRLHDVFRDCLLYWERDKLPALHRRLTDNLRIGMSTGVMALPDEYAWRNLAYHLIEGGQPDRLRALLLDYHYLRAKLGVTDASALVADCDALLKIGTDETIRVLRSAILLSENALAQDADALGHQLVGRIMSHRKHNTELRTLTDSIPALQPGLYPIDFDSEYVTHEQAGGPLLRTLSGHIENVKGAQILVNGRLLSWSADSTLRLWSSDGALLMVFEGHTNSVNGVLELADGRLLSWSADSTLRLWSSDGALLMVFGGHTNWVNGALELADGRLLSWSADSTLRLWSSDGTPLSVLEGHIHSITGVLELANGRFLSWSGVIPSEDHTLRLWASHGVLLAILEGHGSSVNGAQELTNGRILSCSADNTLRLWTADGAPLSVLTGHNFWATGMFELADGRFLSTSLDNTLRLWISDGTPLAVLQGHSSSVNGGLELTDGRLVSWSSDGTLRLWASDGTPLAVLQGHSGPINGTLELSDGRLVSWSSDGTLRLWIADNASVASLTPHTGAVDELQVLTDGRVLSWSSGSFIRNKDRVLRLWASDGTPLTVLAGHNYDVNGALVLSNGRFLSWSQDETLRLWSSDGAPLTVLEGHTSGIKGALTLADGRILSWSNDHTLRLWTSDGAALAVLEGHTDLVEGALELSDGRFLSWSDDGTLRLWGTDGTLITVLKGHTNTVIGTRALENGQLLSWSSDNTICLWTSDGALLTVLKGHTSTIIGVRALENGRLLSWSSDNTIRLWTSDGALLIVLKGHTSTIIGTRALKDGRLLSWSSDNTICLWTSDGVLLTVLNQDYYSRNRQTMIRLAHEQNIDLDELLPNDLSTRLGLVQQSRNCIGLYNPTDGISITCFYSDADFMNSALLSDKVTIAAADEVGRVIFLRYRDH